ncbi:MAG: DUF2997 domain-containing protein [Oceanidesulfovibrio sp.]
MSKKMIIVTIAEDGSVQIETSGYTGKACLEESQFIKDLLGYETAVQLCPAYYRKGKQTVKKHLPLCG